MTCVIQYDATNGSDTAPLGNHGSGTNGDIAGTTLTLNETKNFTGVANDDTDYLWYQGNAGDRHLFRITAFNPSVAACTSLTLVETCTASRTGKSWAVNGERKTLANDTSRYDWQDMRPGWTFEFQDGTYDFGARIASTVADGDDTSGTTKWKAKSGHAPILRSTTNTEFFEYSPSYTEFHGIKFTTSASPKTSTALYWRAGTVVYGALFRNCTFDGLQKVGKGYNSGASVWLGCTFVNMVSDVFDSDTYGHVGFFRDCVFKNNGAWAISGQGSVGANAGLHMVRCIIHNNTSGGVKCQANGYFAFEHCVFDGNGASGILIDTVTVDVNHVFSARNCIFSNNTRYGIENVDAKGYIDVDYCAYRSNSIGDVLNITEGAGVVDLTADPYTDRANDVFTLNATAGGGLACRGTGQNGFDIGYYQHTDSGGGSVIVIED